MMVRSSALRVLTAASLGALTLTLAACGDSAGKERTLAELDDKLTGKNADPAANAALEDQILIDPELTDSANGNAVRAPGQPANGALPADTAPAGGEASAADLGGMKLLSAGKPRVLSQEEECADCAAKREGVTLGAKAEMQASGQKANGTCDANLTYDLAWAQKMPATFPVYPKARVQEAAGVANGACNIRAVSFSTANGMQQVVDYYFTRAKADGFSAEYVLRDGLHALGGLRAKDDGAYYISFTPRKDGGTNVDLIANGGR